MICGRTDAVSQVLLLRMAKKDFAVTSKGRNFTVPKGHYVATSPYVAMQLPDVFHQPEKVIYFYRSGCSSVTVILIVVMVSSIAV